VINIWLFTLNWDIIFTF